MRNAVYNTGYHVKSRFVNESPGKNSTEHLDQAFSIYHRGLHWRFHVRNGSLERLAVV